jgi:hypothetical protein
LREEVGEFFAAGEGAGAPGVWGEGCVDGGQVTGFVGGVGQTRGVDEMVNGFLRQQQVLGVVAGLDGEQLRTSVLPSHGRVGRGRVGL